MKKLLSILLASLIIMSSLSVINVFAQTDINQTEITDTTETTDSTSETTSVATETTEPTTETTEPTTEATEPSTEVTEATEPTTETTEPTIIETTEVSTEASEVTEQTENSTETTIPTETTDSTTATLPPTYSDKEIISGDYIYLPLTKNTAMLVEYLGDDTKITTPATIDGYKIVSIGDGAFICKFDITDVVISDGVTSIGEYAFCACHSLASVTFPETLVSIGRRAFRANFQLTSVDIPDSVEEIQRGAFANTPKLADVKIGTGIKAIGDDAFNQTDILTISGYVNTVAFDYAYENGIKFNSLGVAPILPTPTVEKKANPIKVTVKNTTVSAKKLTGKKQTVKPITVKNAKGTVEVVKVKSGTTSKIYKKITVNKKTGAITFSKGKYSKKTYSIKLKITAKGNTEYKSKVITKTVKVKVK